MKNLISILLGIFLSTNITFAQNSTIFQQNEGKSKRTQILHALAGSSQTFIKHKNTLNDDIASITYQYSSEDGWENNGRILFTYDNANNYFEELFQVYNSESWDDHTKTEYFLTSLGLPSKISEYDFDGTELTERSTNTYYYSPNNRVDSVVYESSSAKEITSFNYITADSIEFIGQWYYNGSLESTYNGSVVQQNNVLVITYDDTRDTYTDFSIENYITQDVNYLSFNSYLFEVLDTLNQWIPLERITYEKENGKLISGTFEYYYEDAWLLQTKSSFIYEEDDLISVVDTSIYGEYTDVYRQLYTYNKNVGIEEELANTQFSLQQNYPNPFNPITTIPYTLNSTQKVTLSVYNMLGQRVAQLVDGIQSSGNHSVSFDASNLTTGIYIYRLQSAEQTSSRKLLVIK